MARRRKRRKNPRSWFYQHPVLSTVLGVVALGTVGSILASKA
jgi:hypothetical protein